MAEPSYTALGYTEALRNIARRTPLLEHSGRQALFDAANVIEELEKHLQALMADAE